MPAAQSLAADSVAEDRIGNGVALTNMGISEYHTLLPGEDEMVDVGLLVDLCKKIRKCLDRDGRHCSA